MHVDSRCYVEIKTHGVATFAEAASLRGAVDIMKRNNIWRLPVMMGDRLLGFLVGANLVGALAVLTPASDHPANDANTRNSILAALDRGGDASARVALNRTVH
jgi:predicted transcriptional regulator